MRNPGERDRSIEALLRRQREDVAPSPGADQCVDAETLAAWIDGTLVGEDLAAAEGHSAGCARCQAMLASMARIAPPITSRPWWGSVTIRWVVPVAAAATALALWVSVDRQPNTGVAPAAQTATSPADKSVALPARSPDEQARDSVEQKKDAPAPSAKAAAPIDALARRESPPGFDARSSGVSGGQTASETRSSLQARSDNVASLATPAAATSAPAAPPVPPPPPPLAGPVAGSPVPPPAAEPFKPPSLAETVNVITDSPSLEKSALGQGRGGTAFRTADILSPEPAFRWRIGAPGTILRSTDGGATWISQRTPAPVAIAAGSAPAPGVCWIVGRSGAVMLTADGTAWQLRPFPEAADLTAVRAVDSKTAVVTTADGRQFSTTDGGATWSKLPLQEK